MTIVWDRKLTLGLDSFVALTETNLPHHVGRPCTSHASLLQAIAQERRNLDLSTPEYTVLLSNDIRRLVSIPQMLISPPYK